MAFLIQNTQARDANALQVKVDGLLRVTEGARLALLNLAASSATELERVKGGFIKLGEQEREKTGDQP